MKDVTTDVVQRVEDTVVPALTLDEDIYLPDRKSQEKYSELIEQSNLAPVKLEDGKISLNTSGGLKGGQIRPFLEEQQEQLQKDFIC